MKHVWKTYNKFKENLVRKTEDKRPYAKCKCNVGKNLNGC
jgi:hypothetical protein